MAKVQFQVDGLDSNLPSVFNQDVVFDGNVDVGGLSIANVDLSDLYASISYVDSALGGITVDLSTAAGAGIDWNISTSSFDINISTSDISEGSNLYFTDERAQDAVGNSLSNLFAYNDSTGGITLNNAKLSDFLMDGASGNSYGLIGTSAYLDVKNTNGYNKEIELDIAAVESKLVVDGFAKLTDIPSLTSYAPLQSPTFSGTVDFSGATVTGITALPTQTGNSGKYLTTNGTAASWATLTLTDYATKESPTFTGTATTSDLIVNGDFTVNGTNFSASATTITIEDNMVQLAHQNAANVVDLGLVVAYNDGTAKHSGIVRDVSDDKWKIFKGVTTEPTTTVNFSQGSLDTLAVAGIEAITASIGDVSNTELQYLNGVTSAIQTQLDGKLNNSGAVNFAGYITETATISATSAATTVNYDVITNNNILHYTSAPSANWTLNIRGNSSTSLNSILEIGKSLSLVFLVSNGATAYYQTALQIDGNAITPKWPNGSAPTFGNSSSIDAYEVTIIKTASNTYTVLENLTRFA